MSTPRIPLPEGNVEFQPPGQASLLVKNGTDYSPVSATNPMPSIDKGGQSGAVVETGTTAITGSFTAITALADTVFASLTVTGWSGDSTAGLPLPAGVTLFGQITAFTLTSGKVVAYL
jgi:hypothetical protein